MNLEVIGQERPLILVVDDDQMTRRLVRHVMEQAGYRVAESGDGEASLATALELRPDIVLLDALMPRIDGFAVCCPTRSGVGGRHASTDDHRPG